MITTFSDNATDFLLFTFRRDDRSDDDDRQRGNAFVFRACFLRQSDRRLSGRLLYVRFRCSARIRGRQLQLLGNESDTQEQEAQTIAPSPTRTGVVITVTIGLCIKLYKYLKVFFAVAQDR